MCFEKKVNSKKSKIAKVDMYVLKTNAVYDNHCIARKGFKYLKDVLYKKGIWKKAIALFRRDLEGEVFHARSVEESKRMLIDSYSWYFTPKTEYYEDDEIKKVYSCGIFMIPKGTRYYENKDVIATFAIKFLCPLTKENMKIVLQQKPLHETVQMAEGQTKNM